MKRRTDDTIILYIICYKRGRRRRRRRRFLVLFPVGGIHYTARGVHVMRTRLFCLRITLYVLPTDEIGRLLRTLHECLRYDRRRRLYDAYYTVILLFDFTFYKCFTDRTYTPRRVQHMRESIIIITLLDV